MDSNIRFSIEIFPNYVERFDGAEIVAWDDISESYQKKILNGTMTDEDWIADWTKPVPEVEIEDVVSSLLNHPSMSENLKPNHVHVWRKEYPSCMIKGCGATNVQNLPPMAGN